MDLYDVGSYLPEALTDALAQMMAIAGVVFLIISTIYALLNCFFGYQLKKVWVTLIGFGVGFLLGFLSCLIWIESSAVVGIAVAVGLVVGVLLALLAYRLYRVGVFLWMALLTFGSVASLFDGNIEWLGIVLGVVAGVVVGVLSLRYLRPVCIFSTAINGGILAAQNIFTLCNITQVGIVLGVGLALAVLGMLLQFHLSKPKSAPEAS